MATVQVEKVIRASVQRVFELASDIPNVPQYQPAIIKIEMLTDGPIGVGARWRETRVAMGKEATVELNIVAFDPPSGYTVECEAFSTHFSTRIETVPHAEGTLASMIMVSTPKSLMAKLLGPLMNGAMKKVCGATWKRWRVLRKVVSGRVEECVGRCGRFRCELCRSFESL